MTHATAVTSECVIIGHALGRVALTGDKEFAQRVSAFEYFSGVLVGATLLHQLAPLRLCHHVEKQLSGFDFGSLAKLLHDGLFEDRRPAQIVGRQFCLCLSVARLGHFSRFSSPRFERRVFEFWSNNFVNDVFVRFVKD